MSWTQQPELRIAFFCLSVFFAMVFVGVSSSLATIAYLRGGTARIVAAEVLIVDRDGNDVISLSKGEDDGGTLVLSRGGVERIEMAVRDDSVMISMLDSRQQDIVLLGGKDDAGGALLLSRVGSRSAYLGGAKAREGTLKLFDADGHEWFVGGRAPRFDGFIRGFLMKDVDDQGRWLAVSPRDPTAGVFYETYSWTDPASSPTQ